VNSIPSQGGSLPDTEEAFYAATYRRLVWIMAVLALVGAPVAWIRYGRWTALTFAVGSLLGVLNFYWLKRAVEAMGGRLPGRFRSVFGVVVRFLLRYVLIAIIAYVILKSTASSLYGFFAGLSLPVGAILIEAAYEMYRALRTGI
jgi:hypothetical protein